MKNVKFPALMPTAEPFFFPGNRTGCLLIHGFTGTPKEMRQLGAHLSSQGYTVLGIRLPGHATQLQDMQRMRWRDWIASLEDGWHILSGCTDQIFIMGLSMGGVLAWIENSSHVITSDAQRETVFQAVSSFVLHYSRLPAV